MNKESLNEAIEDFNNWSKAAKVYFNKKEGYFFTEVFVNDVNATATIPSDGIVAVYSKDEIRGNKKITELRKEYIERYTKLLLEGRDSWQAEMDLAEFAYRNNI
jgi:hypothetical protein